MITTSWHYVFKATFLGFFNSPFSGVKPCKVAFTVFIPSCVKMIRLEPSFAYTNGKFVWIIVSNICFCDFYSGSGFPLQT